jgi:methylase of polypeptide subunit release factors
MTPSRHLLLENTGEPRTHLPPLRLAAARGVLGRLVHWRYRLLDRRRHSDIVLERIAGIPLLVAPGVLNPRLMRSGGFFASRLGPALIASGADVLDMGTGSGVCALVAARHARSVVAVDISAAAVRCAHVNVLLNGLEHKIEVLSGDLFAPVKGRTFDVVLFNLPFCRGVPSDDADRAWRSIDVPERFAIGLAGHLKPRGFALVVLSTFGDANGFIRTFREHGLAPAVLAERSYINERLTLLELRPAAALESAGCS